MSGGHDQKDAWIQRVLGIDVTAQKAAENGQIDGLAAWQAARQIAIGSLKALESAYRGFDDPEVPQAIILLRAIQANLTETPATRQQVDQLRRYLEEDDIIEDAEEPNGFGVTVKLREPLLGALAQLRPPE
jgi:hypothetical protein